MRTHASHPFSSDKIHYPMNRTRTLAHRSSQAPTIVASEGPGFSSDNVLAEFVTFLANDTKVGERTARLYLAHLRRFAAWLADRYQAPLLEATTRDLRQYKAERAERQKPASLNAALAALRRFFGWAAATDRMARSPAEHLTDVARQPLGPKGFTVVERRRLIREAEKAGPMAEAIVAMLLNTGLRVDELVRLRWEGVQLQPRSGWIDVVGKGDKHRRLPLNSDARQALEALQAEIRGQPSGPIFRGKRGPYTARGVEYVVAELGRRANVAAVHPHRFRHDAGRRLVEAVDLPTVAAWLGHERLDTVRIYSHPDDAALERAAIALEGL
jgi:integrase/recombinase XerC